MSVEYGNRALSELIRQAEAGEILLPNFQRSFVWAADQQRAVSTSVLLDIPSGSLLLIRGSQGDYDCREVGVKERFTPSADETACDFLLDGQQRLTSLRQVFGDPFATHWEDNLRATYSILKARWSMQIRPKTEDDNDIFGLRNLKFPGFPVEPDIVGDALNRHPVLITKGLDNWFHPKFNPGLGRSQRNNAVGQLAAHDGAVPLWGVLSGDFQAMETALKIISTKQFEELRAQIQDGELDSGLMQQLTESLNGAGNPDVDLLTEELRNRRAQWQTDVQSALKAVRDYKMSTIQLTQDELSKAIVIFEAINRGGTPLTPFDLVSARYSKGTDPTGKSLPTLVTDFIGQFEESVPDELSDTATWKPSPGLMVIDDELTSSFKTYFLQTLSASAVEDNIGVDDFKQARFLKLEPNRIAQGWEPSTAAVVEAWRFLQLRCFVPTEGSLRNKLVLLPIALLLANPDLPRTKSTFDRMEYWYWCSVLTSTYSSRQNENCVADVNSLSEWLLGANVANPFASRAQRVLADPQYSDRETLLRLGEDSVGTDVGEYFLQAVSAMGGQDLLESRRLNPATDEIEDHHLIPLGSAVSVGQSTKEIRKGSGDLARLLTSPVNRAYVLKASNRKISALAIAQYMTVVPASVQSSLFFSNNSFHRLDGESDQEFALRVLSPRFDMVKASITNRLTQLVGP